MVKAVQVGAIPEGDDAGSGRRPGDFVSRADYVRSPSGVDRDSLHAVGQDEGVIHRSPHAARSSGSVGGAAFGTGGTEDQTDLISSDTLRPLAAAASARACHSLSRSQMTRRRTGFGSTQSPSVVGEHCTFHRSLRRSQGMSSDFVPTDGTGGTMGPCPFGVGCRAPRPSSPGPCGRTQRGRRPRSGSASGRIGQVTDSDGRRPCSAG